MSPNTPRPLPQPRITQTHAVTELVLSQRATAPPHRPHFAREQLHAPSLSLNSAATKFGSNATAPARSDTRTNASQLLALTSTAAGNPSLPSNNPTVIARACSCVSLLNAYGGAAPIKLTLLLHLQKMSAWMQRTRVAQQRSRQRLRMQRVQGGGRYGSDGSAAVGLSPLPDMCIHTGAATGNCRDWGVQAWTTSAAQSALMPAAATTLMRPAAA